MFTPKSFHVELIFGSCQTNLMGTVCKTTGYVLDSQTRFTTVNGIFLFADSFMLSLESTQPSMKWIPKTTYWPENPSGSKFNLQFLYVVGSKSFRPDQLFKVTEIKQLCYFST